MSVARFARFEGGPCPMPERESIHKGEEWAERYGEWWHEHVRPHIIGGQ